MQDVYEMQCVCTQHDLMGYNTNKQRVMGTHQPLESTVFPVYTAPGIPGLRLLKTHTHTPQKTQDIITPPILSTDGTET